MGSLDHLVIKSWRHLFICLFVYLFIYLLSPSPVLAQQGGAGINISPADPNQRPTIEALQALGASWVRFVYVPENEAKYNFSYDAYINELNQAGIDVVMVLNQQTLWAPNMQVTSGYVSDFANMAGQLAAHYGSQVAAYEIWNEQDAKNNIASIYVPPENYASLLAAAYNAIKTNSTSNVIVGGMVAGDPGYLRAVIEAAGGLPADGVGVHPYIPGLNTEGAFRQTFLNFLAATEGKPLWITEFGWETLNQQDQANYLKMVYELVASEFGNQIAATLWYTFTDRSGMGFGLVDVLGNPKLAFQYFQLYAALLESILPYFPFFPFPIPTPPPYEIPPLICSPEADGDPDSRPYYNLDCDLCNLTGMYCPSCATSFTVGTTVEWKWKNKSCEIDGIWMEKNWGGTVIIDPTETEIPFVGKKGNEDEKLYLADYFDGTNEYYYKQTRSYHRYWLDWIDHAGVWRKLTPMGYQDILKEEMVERAVAATPEPREGNIHNYEVDFIGRVCWDLPFLAEAFAIFLKNFEIDIPGTGLVRLAAEEIVDKAHWCVFSDDVPGPHAYLTAIHLFNAAINEVIPGDFLNISHSLEERATDRLASLDGHFPPQPDEEDYVEKWQAWKESRWGRLWTATPMSSREDTPGWISPYYSYRRDDTPKYIEPRVEKVPHVARLYESTQEIQDMLFPSTERGFISQKEENPFCAAPQTSGPIIASPSEEKVLGNKTREKLLAQGEAPASASLVLAPIGCTLKPLVQIDICPGGGNAYHYVGDCGIFMANIFTLPCGSGCVRGDPQCPGIDLNGLAEGQTATSCVYIEMTEVENCQGIRNTTVCCSVTKTGPGCGDYTSDCATGPPPPALTCEIPPGYPVPRCAMDSITDENPNDDLCCEEIGIDVSYWDAFPEADDYIWTPCSPECGCCGVPCCDDYPPGMAPPNCSNKKCVCPDDPCLTPVYRTVSRDWGINLSHPYLTQIWEQTAKNESNGVFNFFRPFEIPEFEELDAHSTIDYEFDGGWERPSDGKFYYNYLGGVQKAKEWVTTKALMPYKE